MCVLNCEYVVFFFLILHSCKQKIAALLFKNVLITSLIVNINHIMQLSLGCTQKQNLSVSLALLKPIKLIYKLLGISLFCTSSLPGA